jgi:hypothetical protein
MSKKFIHIMAYFVILFNFKYKHIIIFQLLLSDESIN